MRNSLDFLLDTADFDVTLFECAQHSSMRFPASFWLRGLRRAHARH